MRDKLRDIIIKYEGMNQQLMDPAIISNQNEFRKISKEHSDITPIVQKAIQYLKVLDDIDAARELLEGDDADMKELAKAEIDELEPQVPEMEAEMKILLIPKDASDEKNVILEIRAGTGGEEAALFGASLFRMYTKYAESKGWKVETLDSNITGLGGLKEITASVSGKGVYSRFKFESGVHRVQRVPETETQGRVHTSAATVAVLPEAEEVDLKIEEKDLRVDTYCSSGPGGQGVNTTYSAVRIVHIPTGVMVQCQDGRSQIKNKDKAMKVLRARLYELELEKVESERSDARKSQVGSGDRSERIRTYNYPQNRVSDHRAGITLYKLDLILEGDMDTLFDGVTEYFQLKQLQEL
jgi:peptide chain release factor 1